jgi:hypothetical protein
MKNLNRKNGRKLDMNSKLFKNTGIVYENACAVLQLTLLALRGGCLAIGSYLLPL